MSLYSTASSAARPEGGRIVNVFHGTTRGRVLADRRSRRFLANVAEFVFTGRMQARAARRHWPVAVSRSAGRQLFWLYGVSGARVIQNAVDVSRFSAGDRQAARQELGCRLDPVSISMHRGSNLESVRGS